jgi:hypothetical protein
MQTVSLLFAGRRGLEDQLTRQAILRIPEVSRRISQAQKIIEQLYPTFQNDLYSYIQQNDLEFNNQKNLKSLVTAIVQIGLYDRFIKFRNKPQFLIGLANPNSALKVCTGLLSFEEYILESEFCAQLQNISQIPLQQVQLLGLSLEEYCVYFFDIELNQYKMIELNSKDPVRLLEKIHIDNTNLQCIHIGPHCEFRLKEFESINLFGLPSINSIDLDPILSSFWKTA